MQTDDPQDQRQQPIEPAGSSPPDNVGDDPPPSRSSAESDPGRGGVNVNVNVGSPSVVVVQDKSGHALLVRAIWFVFIGWWAGFFWAISAWLLNLTIIGLPLGILMLNRLPTVVTLRSSQKISSASVSAAGVVVVEQGGPDQFPWWLRAIFFVLVGSWLSLLWIIFAYLLIFTLVGMPLAFVMFDYIAAVTTLRKLK